MGCTIRPLDMLRAGVLFAQEATHISACVAEESASESVLVCIECGIFTKSAANFEGHKRGAKHAARLELTEGLHSSPAWCRGCCSTLWQSPASAVAYSGSGLESDIEGSEYSDLHGGDARANVS